MGGFSGCKSHSEGDWRLCRKLAFWTRNDPHRIDRLFRRSGLYRPKWDSQRGETTYGAQTISAAITANRAKGACYKPAGAITMIRQQILEALRQSPVPLSPSETAVSIGQPGKSLRMHLVRMHEVGLVSRVPGGGGYVALPEACEPE